MDHSLVVKLALSLVLGQTFLCYLTLMSVKPRGTEVESRCAVDVILFLFVLPSHMAFLWC